MERVYDEIKEAKNSHNNHLKRIENNQIAILLEMKEQVSETGICLLKTPAVTYTLTRKGIKEQRFGFKPSLYDDNYSVFLSELTNMVSAVQNKFYTDTNQKIKGLDLEAAENVTNLLNNIVKKHNFKITGKYLHK
jgi:hypothetical protein